MRKILTFFLFILISLATFSQTSFEEEVIMDDSYVLGGGESFFGDIDNDGDLDVMSAGNRSVAWFENIDGQGTYSSRKLIASYPIGHYISSRFLADLDGDGDLDVMAAVSSPDRITWYENLDGQGTFGTQQVVANFNGSIYVADLDSDNDLDVLIYSPYQNGEMSWLKNLDGLGHFGSKTIIATGITSPRHLQTADLDGDNDNDLLFASNDDNKIVWYRNMDGQGNFGNEIILSDLEQGPTSVFVSDMDSDGDLDVITSNSSTFDRIAWYENTDGQGTFGSSHIVSNNVNNPTVFYAADIDNDGDNDILASVSNSGIDSIVFYENLDGQGNFGVSNTISDNVNIPISIKAADIDSDGYLDVLCSSFGDDKITWYKNMDGQGNFGIQQYISEDVEGAQNVFSADLDGDGDLDLLVASNSYFNGNPGNSKISWFENIDGSGTLSRQKIIGYLNRAILVRAADVDADGDLDVIGASFSSSIRGIVIYKNIDGLGNFVEASHLSSGVHQLTTIETADFDDDEDMDILYTSWNGIGWIENMDGQGNFEEFHELPFGGGFNSIACTADLDGDGDMDIITWHQSSGGKVIWYENLNGGTFSSAKLIYDVDHSSYMNDLKTADMDLDGDLDVVVCSISDDEYILWVENLDGNGNFGNPTTITAHESIPSNIEVGDFDNDNDIDVAFVSHFQDSVGWIQNIDGEGNFGPETILTEDLFEPIYVHVTDLDGDGDQDILGVSDLFNTILWYKNSLILSLYENNTLNFKAYPNPTNGLITINLATKIKTIKIYNSLGQEMLIIKDAENIDISNLERGIYYLKVTNIYDQVGTTQIIKN